MDDSTAKLNARIEHLEAVVACLMASLPDDVAGPAHRMWEKLARLSLARAESNPPATDEQLDVHVGAKKELDDKIVKARNLMHPAGPLQRARKP